MTFEVNGVPALFLFGLVLVILVIGCVTVLKWLGRYFKEQKEETSDSQRDRIYQKAMSAASDQAHVLPSHDDSGRNLPKDAEHLFEDPEFKQWLEGLLVRNAEKTVDIVKEEGLFEQHGILGSTKKVLEFYAKLENYEPDTDGEYAVLNDRGRLSADMLRKM